MKYCSYEIEVQSDEGHEVATIKCELEEGHFGNCCNKFEDYTGKLVVTTWIQKEKK